MRVLVQRVSSATVRKDERLRTKISHGLVLYVGVCEEDTIETIQWMVQKLIKLRIFKNEDGKMDRTVGEVRGQVLSISTYYLYGEYTKGTGLTYFEPLKGERAKALYDGFNSRLRSYIPVRTSQFGTELEVTTCNDGPLTILLER